MGEAGLAHRQATGCSGSGRTQLQGRQQKPQLRQHSTPAVAAALCCGIAVALPCMAPCPAVTEPPSIDTETGSPATNAGGSRHAGFLKAHSMFSPNLRLQKAASQYSRAGATRATPACRTQLAPPCTAQRTRQQLVDEAAHAGRIPQAVQPAAQRTLRQERLILPHLLHNGALVLSAGQGRKEGQVGAGPQGR